MLSLICLSHNKLPFLKDFVKSLEYYSYPDTQLVLCLQGCTDGSVEWVARHSFTRPTTVVVEQENIGLNRYDDLVPFCKSEILVDTDDDVVFTEGGWEKELEAVAEKVGFAGLPYEGQELLLMPNAKTHRVNGAQIVDSAVSGTLAVTTKKVWKEVGGFGKVESLFLPEDARYQSKCHQAGYVTGTLQTKAYYAHHTGWEWAIRYDRMTERLNSLHAALMSGFISEPQFRVLMSEFNQVYDQMRPK